MAEFLETAPPDTQLQVENVGKLEVGRLVLVSEDVRLPCNNERCEGKGDLHFYKLGGADYLERGKWKFTFVTYVCRNCRQTSKTYGIVAKLDDEGFSGTVLKLGETPPFGPEVPSRVISLIGPDREIFLMGRRAENRGFGIGAFAYYRRVVENQKGRIIEEMARVAKKLGASEADLRLFDAAEKETKFSEAIDRVSTAIPAALRIDGHNPLTLLHTALSDGIHERSDRECLECAREIRLVLTELAERMAQVLREKADLKDAVSKLLERGTRKKLAEGK